MTTGTQQRQARVHALLSGLGTYEQARIRFAVQATDDGEGTFTGMASVFNTLIDTWIPTRILPGAFAKTLADPAQMSRCKILWQHDDYTPIGVPTSMVENSDGLLVNGKISQTSVGKDCLVLMRDKVITELSIGFDPVAWSMTEEGEGKQAVRLITEVRLWEFSPVTFAANRDAKIFSVHSMARQVRQRMRHAVGGTLPPEWAMVDGLIDAVDASYDCLMAANGHLDTEDDDTQAAQQLRESLGAIVMPALLRCSKELHQGKVLSAKNRTLMQQAIDALQAIIVAADAPADPADDADQNRRAAAPAQLSAAMRELDLMSIDLAVNTTRHEGAVAHA